jgi:8-oxo-dGTP diphosphatase
MDADARPAMRRPPGALGRLPLPIETPRLELRLPSKRDVPDLRRSFRDPRTARAEGAPLHSRLEMREPERMVARTLREYRRGEHLSLSVILREGRRCVGRVGLRGLDWTHRKVESLSYWVDPAYWNRGIATEASWYLCRAAFGPLRLRRVASQALDRNQRSLAVLRKLGFVEEGRERAAVCVRGRCIDMLLFGLLRGELKPLARSPAEPPAAGPRPPAPRLRLGRSSRSRGGGRGPGDPP